MSISRRDPFNLRAKQDAIEAEAIAKRKTVAWMLPILAAGMLAIWLLGPLLDWLNPPPRQGGQVVSLPVKLPPAVPGQR